jgi:hypothetical protein
MALKTAKRSGPLFANTAKHPGTFPTSTARRCGPLSTPLMVVGLIIVLAIAYLLLQGSSVQQISSNKTITLAVNSSFNFDLPSNSNASSVFLASSSSSTALLYLSRLPVLEKGGCSLCRLQRGRW